MKPGSAPLFTVFIPTFNRADTLPGAFESIEQQTLRDFEVLVVDDGSTDDTRRVVEEWTARVDFEVRYYYQENQGKNAAHNFAISLARGEFVVLLDSDDRMLPECLESLQSAWTAIPDAEKPAFAGIQGLCIDSQGRISGERFPQDVFDSDYLEFTYRYRIGGEKKSAIRTDVLREFPYPLIGGETHMRDSIIWERMAHKYKFRCINVPLQVFEYRPDGLTRNVFARRMRNLGGLQYYWEEHISRHTRYMSPKQLHRSYTQFVRYSLHLGIGYKAQWQRVPRRRALVMAIPTGTLEWMGDRLKKRFRQNK